MLSSLSSVPPVWPSPRPEIIGTKPPQAAIAGARIRLTLSPTPPVECLSRMGPGRLSGFQSSTVPERVIGERQCHPLVQVHAAEEHGHAEGRDLALRHGARRDALDEALDLRVVETAAVAFDADDFLGEHGSGFALLDHSVSSRWRASAGSYPGPDRPAAHPASRWRRSGRWRASPIPARAAHRTDAGTRRLPQCRGCRRPP